MSDRRISVHAPLQTGPHLLRRPAAVFLTRRPASLVIQTVRTDIFAFPGHAAEKGAFGKLGEFDPGFDGGDGAGGVGGTAPDLDFTPAGLAALCHQHVLRAY